MAVRVDAPVPPLEAARVPARVMVPEVVIGPPEVVRPVVPPDTATLVTEPPPVMPRLVLASVAFVAPVPPWEMLSGVVKPVKLVIELFAPLVAYPVIEAPAGIVTVPVKVGLARGARVVSVG